MNKILLIVLSFIYSSISFSQGITFEKNLSWQQIKEKAAAERKSIFLDIYTTWCLPCIHMDEKVYPSKEAGDYFNDHFISVKVQMDSTKKDDDNIRSWYGTAQDLFYDYNIVAYPSMVFTTATGEPLFKTDGILNVQHLIEAAKLALDSSSSYAGKYRDYLRGNRNSAFVLDLVRMGREVGQASQARKVAIEYISGLKDKDLFKPDNLWIMYENTKSSKDRGFEIFLNNAKKVQSAESKLSVPYSNSLVDNIIQQEDIIPYLHTLNNDADLDRIKNNLAKYGERGDLLFKKNEYGIAGEKFGSVYKNKIQPLIEKDASWPEVLSVIKNENAGKGEERLIGLTIIAYLRETSNGTKQSLDKLFSAATLYEKQYPFLLWSRGLNDWAWTFFEKSDNKQYLESALRWSETSIKLEPGSPNLMDTYANLLFKLGYKKKAIEWESKALENAPGDPGMTEALKKMKQ